MTLPLHAATDWNQWRGPQRDGISTETGLLRQWTGDGPPLLWKVEGLGKGYASMSVVDGCIFTLGSQDGKEHLVALSAQDGRKLWSLPFGDGDHSNGTPTVDGDRVYAVGLEGDLICAHAKTGKKIWSRNFGADFGGQMMTGWGYSESPLVDGDRLICSPGAKDAMIVALDKTTGKTIWKAAVPDLGDQGKDGAGYSSIVVSEAAGVRQYVQLTGRGVISVRASDGQFLWGYNRIANDVANIPTPLVSGNFVFCSTGYGTGAALLEVQREGNELKVREVYFLPADKFQNHHGQMIQIGPHVFAGHGHNNGFPICLELQSGQVVWGGKQRGPGSGSAAIAYADGLLVFRYQNGTVALIEATPEAYRLKGEFKPAFQEDNSWAHPVIVDGKLLLREQNVLMCYDVHQP